MDMEPGAVRVWGDLACPWATLAVHRLHAARARTGLEGEVRFDLRAFPLELVNARPTPRHLLDAEIPVVGALAPDFGWQIWHGDPAAYPATVLLALEAVQAAKEQSAAASEQLDLALRRAFFVESRSFGMRHVTLEVAATCADVDVALLAAALDDGRARRTVFEQWQAAEQAGVQGSPHVFLPDGTDIFNPGISTHWRGEKPRGFPVVDGDDPAVYDDLLKRAAA
jgi:predicted DsbA family dithiol-disulfide isomerase